MERAIRMVESGMSKTAAAKKAGVDRRNLIRAFARYERRMGLVRCPCCDVKVPMLKLPEKVVQQIWSVRERYDEGF